jgi:putative ABC transport system permease protein
LPFGVPSLQAAVAAPEDPDGLRRPPVPALAATPSLFRTLGIPIVRGRGFTDADDAAAPPAIILSELGARQYFGSLDAAGRSLRLRLGQDAEKLATVVGVARDTDVGFIYSNRPRPLIYLPLTQLFDPSLTIVARSTGRGERALPALREAIRRADPDLAVKGIGPGDSVLSGPFQLLRSAGMATLYLGGFTLLLSMVGLFGVQSHVVAHRTREIGVRMSVGATARQIKAMVIKDGYRPVIEGLVLGLWGGTAARIVARSYMDVDVDVFDPVMLAVTPIPLILAAFWACYLPASRAARVDPTVALRSE